MSQGFEQDFKKLIWDDSLFIQNCGVNNKDTPNFYKKGFKGCKTMDEKSDWLCNGCQTLNTAIKLIADEQLLKVQEHKKNLRQYFCKQYDERTALKGLKPEGFMCNTRMSKNNVLCYDCEQIEKEFRVEE